MNTPSRSFDEHLRLAYPEGHSFSPGGIERLRYISDTVRDFLAANPDSSESDALAWVRRQLIRLDSGVSRNDLQDPPRRTRGVDSAIGLEIAQGRMQRRQEAIDLMLPYLSPLARYDVKRADLLMDEYLDAATREHPATVVLRMKPEIDRLVALMKSSVRV